MTPREQYLEAYKAVADAHRALYLVERQPQSIGTIPLRIMAELQHTQAHALLRHARRRLVLSGVAFTIEALVVGVIIYLALLGSIALFEQIINR